MNNQKENSKKKKILATDNSHTIRLVIKKFLEDSHEVLEADNGEETFAMLEKDKEICLVIISLELSDCNGFDLAAKLREKYDKKSLPIILSTSNNKREDIMKAMEVGINDYIVKPFPKELLISKIHKLEREIPVKNIKLSDTISKIPFFNGVPESQVAYALNTCSETMIINKGEVLCTQDEEQYDLFILMEGKCDVLFNNKKVTEIMPVETVGEMGFLEEQKRSATVVATERAKVIVFKKEAFGSFLNEDRAISEIICKNLIHTLSERVKRSNILVEQLKMLAHEHLTY